MIQARSLACATISSRLPSCSSHDLSMIVVLAAVLLSGRALLILLSVYFCYSITLQTASRKKQENLLYTSCFPVCFCRRRVAGDSDVRVLADFLDQKGEASVRGGRRSPLATTVPYRLADGEDATLSVTIASPPPNLIPIGMIPK